MSPTQREIHERALHRAKQYDLTERELLESLEEVERNEVYLALGMSSVFQYCVEALNRTEGSASGLIAVMRKAKVIPALKEAIEKGEMNVSRAKRIVSVMDETNAAVWIEKAQSLKQRELEVEIVRENPKVAPPERISPITSERSEVRFTVSSELEEKLNRAKEILNTPSLEAALDKLVTQFLDKNDPAQKKLHSLRNVGRPLQRNIPRSIKNRVLIRDKGQCTYLIKNGARCGSRKWVSVHHVHHFAQGGDHSLSNLATLCYGHHRVVHYREASGVKSLDRVSKSSTLV